MKQGKLLLPATVLGQRLLSQHWVGQAFAGPGVLGHDVAAQDAHLVLALGRRS